jgi:hypothetical protein
MPYTLIDDRIPIHPICPRTDPQMPDSGNQRIAASAAREEERNLAAIMRPHMLQSNENARFLSELECKNRALNSRVDERGRATVLFNAEGTILFRNRRACLCMERWFESRGVSREVLPQTLRWWVAAQLSSIWTIASSCSIAAEKCAAAFTRVSNVALADAEVTKVNKIIPTLPLSTV